MSTPTERSDRVVRRAGDVRFRRIDEETVVIRQQAAEALVLNEVGGRLFELIDGKETVSGLLDRLLEEYEVSRETLERDVASYLEELLLAGVVVEVVPGSDASTTEG